MRECSLTTMLMKVIRETRQSTDRAEVRSSPRARTAWVAMRSPPTGISLHEPRIIRVLMSSTKVALIVLRATVKTAVCSDPSPNLLNEERFAGQYGKTD